jgi:hypothetical protein
LTGLEKNLRVFCAGLVAGDFEQVELFQRLEVVEENLSQQAVLVGTG